MPKILMLYPNPIATIPGGFTYVCKRFKQNGFEVQAFVNTFRNYKTVDEIFRDVVQPSAADIVGLSYSTFNLLEIYRLQQLCRSAGFFVIAGGNHPSIRHSEVFRNGANAVFCGESETEIDEFCEIWDGGDEIRSSGGLLFASYPRITDLDSLGEMDFSFLNLDNFRVQDGSVKGLNVISCGRGCPYRCSFCSHSDWLEHTSRTPASIVNEMVHRNEQYGITDFWFSDETFTVNRDNVYALCELLKGVFSFTWSMGTRVDTVDEKLLRVMKNSGLSQITYGVESADDETLKRTKKGYDSFRAYNTVKLTASLGIPMYINLMTGFPWETGQSVENNIRFIRAVSKHVNCFQLYGAVIPYPDTSIYDEFHEKHGFTDWWLRPEFQSAGMARYQNVMNPYRVSTFYQRNLYDDTYVADETFFKFTSEYKAAVARMGLLIGAKALEAQGFSPWQFASKYTLGYLSRFLYSLTPTLEKRIIGSLLHRSHLHETRGTGRFIKK